MGKCDIQIPSIAFEFPSSLFSSTYDTMYYTLPKQKPQRTLYLLYHKNSSSLPDPDPDPNPDLNSDAMRMRVICAIKLAHVSKALYLQPVIYRLQAAD